MTSRNTHVLPELLYFFNVFILRVHSTISGPILRLDLIRDLVHVCIWCSGMPWTQWRSSLSGKTLTNRDQTKSRNPKCGFTIVHSIGYWSGPSAPIVAVGTRQTSGEYCYFRTHSRSREVSRDLAVMRLITSWIEPWVKVTKRIYSVPLFSLCFRIIKTPDTC